MSHSIEIVSPRVDGPRTLQVDEGDAPVCLFLDGVFYRERIGIPDLSAVGLRAATLTSGMPRDRHRDFTCAPSFADFILEDVLPRVGAEVSLLVGVSLSGLAVAHLALERPKRFPRIVSQSPSAWWEDERFVQRVRDHGGGGVRAWFSVGTKETETDVHHPPTAMHQRHSQWDSVHRLVDAWGPTARLNTFDGGHEAPGWTEELERAIAWAMG